MARRECSNCGSRNLTEGFDRWICQECGKPTVIATGLAPLEGMHYNDDALDKACRDWVTTNRPDVLRELADTVAGHADDPGPAPAESTAPEGAAPDFPTTEAPVSEIPTPEAEPADEPVTEPAPAEPTPAEPDPAPVEEAANG